MTQANPLITVDELARLLAGAEVSLLDVRWRLGGPPGIDLYLAGHIPGAVLADLDRDLAAPPGPGGRHPMPATADFEAAMRRAGVRDDRPVVVYDDADSTAATAPGRWRAVRSSPALVPLAARAPRPPRSRPGISPRVRGTWSCSTPRRPGR